MPTYSVRHVTTYRYTTDVSASYGELHLLPRERPGQHVATSRVTIEPAPHDLRHRVDWFGNHATYLSIIEPHRELTVTASSRVTVEAQERSLLGEVPWDQLRDRAAAETDPDIADLLLDSPRVVRSPRLAALADASFAPGRPLLAALADLSTRIHGSFAYRPGTTTVATTLDEVLEARSGVCQDFAHVMIGSLRSLGLPARYVSGYLETVAPAGRERLQGADASHAWASVWTGDGGWLDIDPTNDRIVGDRHVTVAWGRDYGDVAPLKGVIYTQGSGHEIEVEVDVVRT